MKRLLSLALLALSLGAAFAQMTEQQMLAAWKADQQANQGYVWTINIHSGTSISVEGLMEARYALNVSMSHVGPTMHGVYNGELRLGATRDTKGFEALLATVGGTLKTNGNADEMESDQYLFLMKEYKDKDAQRWDEYYGSEAMYRGMSSMQRGIVKDMMEGIFQGYVPREKGFEKRLTPVSRGEAFSLPKGSLGSYQTAQIDISNGYLSTSVSAIAEQGVDAEQESRKKAWGRVIDFLGGSHAANYSQTTYSPLPHTITVYPNNVVVFEIYSSEGGPVTAKFYGTIDKVPVGNTILITDKLRKDAVTTKMTDEPIEAQQKAAAAVIAERKAKAAAAEAAELAKKQAEEAAEGQAADAEVMAVWKSDLAMFPTWVGGRDLSIEVYEKQPLTCSFTYHADVDIWPAYVARLKAAGFKMKNRKEEMDGYYKIIDGKYYSIQIDIYNGAEYDDQGHDVIIRELDSSSIQYVKENGEK